MTISATQGRHAATTVAEPEIDLEMERLVETGIQSGLPAGLGEVKGTAVRGAHRAEVPVDMPATATKTKSTKEDLAPQEHAASGHLPWRVLLSGALAVLVVLALAFVAIHGMAQDWHVGARIS